MLGKRIIAITDKVSPDEMPEIITPYKAIDLNNFDETKINITTDFVEKLNEIRKNYIFHNAAPAQHVFSPNLILN